MVQLLGNVCWHSERSTCIWGVMGRLSEELCDYRRSNKILSMDWEERGHYEYEKGGEQIRCILERRVIQSCLVSTRLCV